MHAYKLISLVVLTASLTFAGTVPYTSAGSFLAASAVTNTEDFENGSFGNVGGAYSHNGITFTLLPGHPVVGPYLYISTAVDLNNPAPSTTFALDANGDENFRLELTSGQGFTAIGFNVITNQFSAPVVSLYDSGNTLIDSFSVTQGANTVGYFGVTSDTPIAYATFVVDRGWVENAAIDNVSIGDAAVPEPSTLLLVSLGLVGLLRSRARR